MDDKLQQFVEMKRQDRDRAKERAEWWMKDLINRLQRGLDQMEQGQIPLAVWNDMGASHAAADGAKVDMLITQWVTLARDVAEIEGLVERMESDRP